MHTLLVTLDLVGTFVFALSGAVVGVRHRLDLFGIMILSLAASTAGGVARDVLIGDLPPAAISNWRYIAAAFLAGLITFRWYPHILRLRSPVLVLDAAGLAIFAVSGSIKALTFDLNATSAIVLGVLTGIGGGMVRDLLIKDVPIVFRSEFYAMAALAGAIVVVAGDRIGLPTVLFATAGGALCFGLRIMAIRRAWGLPVARHSVPRSVPPEQTPPGKQHD